MSKNANRTDGTRARGTQQPAQSSKPTPVNGVDRLATVVSSFGLSGFFPWAPATFASLIATGILYYVYPLGSLVQYGVLCGALLLVGTWSSGRIERFLGHDPSAAVIDEVLGMAITLIAVPVTPEVFLLGFAFFRFFDIVKVEPGKRLEKLPGGWGIMMDDFMAGVYAWGCLQVLLHFWPQPHFTRVHGIVAVALGLVLLAFRKPLYSKFGKRRSDMLQVFGKGRKT